MSVQSLMGKTSGAKNDCTLKAPVEECDLGTLTSVSVAVPVGGFQGPSTQCCIYLSLLFPSAGEASLPFLMGWLVIHFCVMGFQGGFFVTCSACLF